MHNILHFIGLSGIAADDLEEIPSWKGIADEFHPTYVVFDLETTGLCK